MRFPVGVVFLDVQRQTDEHLKVLVTVILKEIVGGVSVASQEHVQQQKDEFVVDFTVSQIFERER